jgi:hypothetical protein
VPSTAEASFTVPVFGADTPEVISRLKVPMGKPMIVDPGFMEDVLEPGIRGQDEVVILDAPTLAPLERYSGRYVAEEEYLIARRRC